MKRILLFFLFITLNCFSEIDTNIRRFYNDNVNRNYEEQNNIYEVEKSDRYENEIIDEIIENRSNLKESEITKANEINKSVNERTQQNSTSHIDFSERAENQLKEVKDSIRRLNEN